MAIELYSSQVAPLITWFNNFIGFTELRKRIDRAEEKLRSLPATIPVLEKRFEFHVVYKSLISRNRLHLPIKIDHAQTNRALSFIYSIQIAASLLPAQSIDILKSKVRDCLSPDRDWRELEHEMRALVHYLQAGYKVSLADLESNARFDLLVSNESIEFEVECKTFADTLGNPVTFDQSMAFFEVFISLRKQTGLPKSSGVLTFTKKTRRSWTREEIEREIAAFLHSAPEKIESSDFVIEFQKQSSWDEYLNTGKKSLVFERIAERHETSNYNRVIAVSNSSVIVCEIASTERPRILKSIFGKLRDASGQFSKQRPSVIWGHFLGLDEHDFVRLRDERSPNGLKVFDVIAHWLFRSDARSHVCKLRLSVNGNTLKSHQEVSSRIITPSQYRGFEFSGQAYDLNSNKSIFDAALLKG